MVVTWSFFIGCDLHVATLSEIGRTSYMYIFLDGDILHDGVALYLSSLSHSVFSIAETRERQRGYFFKIGPSLGENEADLG